MSAELHDEVVRALAIPSYAFGDNEAACRFYDVLVKVEATLREGLTPESASTAPSVVTDAMVDRFLSWKLPEDFAPDCGISFKPPPTAHPVGYWPVGTNLLTADQARAMLEHVLALSSESTSITDVCGTCQKHVLDGKRCGRTDCGWVQARQCPITLDDCRKSYMAGGCTKQVCVIEQRLGTPSAAGECPNCRGSGDVNVMTTHLGPDDYEVTVACPQCKGTGGVQSATTALEACRDIFNDFDEHEVRKETRSVQVAWEIGRGK